MKRALVVVGVMIGLLLVTVGASAQSAEAWIPGLASFVLPGLGQLLNDQLDKAILHFGVHVAIIAAGWYVGTLLPWQSIYALSALHLGWAIYSGYDAYTVARDTGFRIGLIPNGVRFAYSF